MKNWFKKISWKSRALIAVAVFALVLVPTHFSHAIFGLDYVAGPAIDSVVSWIFVTLRAIFQSITGGLINLLNYAVYARAYNNVPIVISMWKILRNLSNMFFVLALIYMAFATIFNISKFRFQDMIWRFLIVAVLINFSLSIGGLVIDGSQVLANVFLKSIGNPGTKLGSFLNPAALLKDAPTTGAIDFAGAAGVSLIMDVVLNLMFIFSLLVAVVFSFFRIIAIWGLLIVSPIAWMSYILPGTKQYWSKWWGWFFGWNLFLPVYLFIMYLGLVFLSQGQTVIQQVTGSGDTALFGTGSITVNLVFFYVFAAFFIAFGTTMAAKMTTSMGGSGFEKGLDMARNFVREKRMLYIPGKGFTSVDALQDATSKRFKQFQKEGFQNPKLNILYGGTNATEKERDRLAGEFGVKGAGEKFYKQFTEASNGTFKDIEEEYDLGKLDLDGIKEKVEKYGANDPRGFAYRKLLAKVGHLDKATLNSTLQQLKSNPYAAQDFMKIARESKFSNLSSGDVAKAALAEGDFSYLSSSGNYLPARRELIEHIKGDKDSMEKIDSVDKLEGVLKVLGAEFGAPGATDSVLSSKAKDFLKEAKKVRADVGIEYDIKHPTPVGPGKVLPTKDERWDKVLNAEAKDLADMPLDVWNHGDFQAAMARKIPAPGLRTPGQQKYRDRLASFVLNAKDSAAKQVVLNTNMP